MIVIQSSLPRPVCRQAGGRQAITQSVNLLISQSLNKPIISEMAIFYCKSCDLKFEAEGTKQEWIDPAFGPCSKLTAPCPNNGEECNEYQQPKTSKESTFTGASTCRTQGGCCGCGS